ncbi:MAG: pepsin/retropepsin-like aspartic protease family protein [Acidobacteriota bacterium]
MRSQAGFFAVAILCATITAPARAATAPTAVPFELFHNIVLLEARLNGQGPFWVMLDTGTDPSALDVALVARLGISLGGTAGLGTGGGTDAKKVTEVKIHRVEVGTLVAEDVDALAGGMLARISEKIGRPVAAVLGYSFLRDRVVRIDYPGRRIEFLTELAPQRSQSGRRAVLPFHWDDDDGDVVIEGVKVNGKSLRAVVDTGSNGSLKLTPEAVRELGLEGAASAGASTTNTGYNGAYSASEGTLQSLALDGLTIEHPHATFWKAGTGHDGKKWGVNIGNEIFASYVLTLDYRRSVMVLELPGGKR